MHVFIFVLEIKPCNSNIIRCDIIHLREIESTWEFPFKVVEYVKGLLFWYIFLFTCQTSRKVFFYWLNTTATVAHRHSFVEYLRLELYLRNAHFPTPTLLYIEFLCQKAEKAWCCCHVPFIFSPTKVPISKFTANVRWITCAATFSVWAILRVFMNFGWTERGKRGNEPKVHFLLLLSHFFTLSSTTNT